MDMDLLNLWSRDMDGYGFYKPHPCQSLVKWKTTDAILFLYGRGTIKSLAHHALFKKSTLNDTPYYIEQVSNNSHYNFIFISKKINHNVTSLRLVGDAHEYLPNPVSMNQWGARSSRALQLH